MYASDNTDQAATSYDEVRRSIESISSTAKSLMSYIVNHPRPCGVSSGDVIVYNFELTDSNGLDDIMDQTAKLAAGMKIKYRNGRISMYEMGAYDRTLQGVQGNLKHLVMHTSGHLKIMNENSYFDVNKFDMTIYTKSDSVSFVVTLYRA